MLTRAKAVLCGCCLFFPPCLIHNVHELIISLLSSHSFGKLVAQFFCSCRQRSRRNHALRRNTKREREKKGGAQVMRRWGRCWPNYKKKRSPSEKWREEREEHLRQADILPFLWFHCCAVVVVVVALQLFFLCVCWFRRRATAVRLHYFFSRYRSERSFSFCLFFSSFSLSLNWSPVPFLLHEPHSLFSLSLSVRSSTFSCPVDECVRVQ